MPLLDVSHYCEQFSSQPQFHEEKRRRDMKHIDNFLTSRSVELFFAPIFSTRWKVSIKNTAFDWGLTYWFVIVTWIQWKRSALQHFCKSSRQNAFILIIMYLNSQDIRLMYSYKSSCRATYGRHRLHNHIRSNFFFLTKKDVGRYL